MKKVTLEKVDNHLQRVEIKLEKVDNRLQRVEVKLEKVDNRLQRVEIKLEKVDKNLQDFRSETDKRFKDTQEWFSTLAGEVFKNSERIEKLEIKVDNIPTKDMFNVLVEKVDQILGKYKNEDQEATFMKYRIRHNTDDIATIKPLVGLS